MTNLQILSNTSTRKGCAGIGKPAILIKPPLQEQRNPQQNSEGNIDIPEFSKGIRASGNHEIADTNEPQEATSFQIFQQKGDTVGQVPSKSSKSSRPQTASSRSSRPNSFRATFLNSPREEFTKYSKHSNTTRNIHPYSSTPQPLNTSLQIFNNDNNRRALSQLSYSSTPVTGGNYLTNGDSTSLSNTHAISCDVLPIKRSSSSQSKYHEGCFPKEDPALIIGSAYRIQSARLRRAKSRKRPIIRYTESLFTHRETVINLVYSANTETEQDELSRARTETEKEARALRSGGLSSGSFSQGFFNQGNRWANSVSRQRGGTLAPQGRSYYHHPQHLMAGSVGPSWQYPTSQEEDSSMSRCSYSRQSFSPHTGSDGSTPPPGLQVFRPTSERSLLSSSRQTDSPNSETGSTHRGSGFLYQVVAFDNLTDNVPPFVRQNVKKNGRMQTDSFILRLNYLRRRRALGETSSTINNNAKAKATAAGTTASSNVTASPGTIMTGQADLKPLS
ncbi:hypothetical protein PoB_003428200 [Plakobranchus ocellatus]|uniref:Uncharacterized protein n=1 Tax=Plakobranchus ocellatus TaxID=259542 RepID=A0AAV4AKK0_9GAST|nr:hypothetical protein PoB_003428200 [Plakobranchus ocellatus]